VDDVVGVIKAQHRTLDRLLDKAMDQDGDVHALLQQVADLLIPHSEAEESFVYPSIKQHQPDEGDEVKDGVAEHHHIEETLRELLSEDPDGPGFDGKLAALVGELRHHVEEEEQDLLPVLESEASDEERAELGERFARETHWAQDSSGDDRTKAELYDAAKEQGVEGRSTMTKDELAAAVDDES
jgi:hemerythrin superfamily protein